MGGDSESVQRLNINLYDKKNIFPSIAGFGLR